jgi:hypothetical protein
LSATTASCWQANVVPVRLDVLRHPRLTVGHARDTAGEVKPHIVIGQDDEQP